MYYCTQYQSPIGPLLLASDGKSLTGLWMEKQKYFDPPPQAEERGDLPVLLQTKEWLDRYFAKKRPAASELPMAPEGSEFRKLIWKLLCQIPYGQVTTYGALAQQAASALGRAQMSAQAVGGAVGHNPISILIPCHRVVGADGTLTGYGGGLDRKRWLLEWEGAGAFS